MGRCQEVGHHATGWHHRFAGDPQRLAPWVCPFLLASLQLAKHPDKTFIGRIEKGFDFLGYHFWPGKLGVAKKTIEHFVARAHRLYEREAGKHDVSSRLGVYVRRWMQWVRAGLTAEARLILVIIEGSVHGRGLSLLSRHGNAQWKYFSNRLPMRVLGEINPH